MEEVIYTDLSENTKDTDYFSVSTSKLHALYLLTFGFYAIFWFYKQWKMQQPHIKQKIMPAARSVFAIFFIHSLTKRVSNSMDSKRLTETQWLQFFATAFVALTIIGNVVSKLAEHEYIPSYFHITWVITFYLSALPLVEIQDKINMLKNDPLGLQNSTYTWKNIIFMVCGGILWLFVIFGLIAIFTGNV